MDQEELKKLRSKMNTTKTVNERKCDTVELREGVMKKENMERDETMGSEEILWRQKAVTYE